MKKIFILLILCLFCLPCFAINDKPTILVLSNERYADKDYYIFGNASDSFTQEIVNDLNLQGFNIAYKQEFVRKHLQEKHRKEAFVTLIKKYENSNSVDFDLVRNINRTIKANYLLLISTNLDIQSYFLKGTVWNTLNIPGLDVINPQYKMSIHVVFADLRTETILYDNIFNEYIKAYNFNLATSQSAPNMIQLSETKRISKKITPSILKGIYYVQSHRINKIMDYVDCKKAISAEEHLKKKQERERKIKQKQEEKQANKDRKIVAKQMNKEQKETSKEITKKEKIEQKLYAEQKEAEIKELKIEQKRMDKIEKQRQKDYQSALKKLEKMKKEQEKNPREFTPKENNFLQIIEDL